MPLIQWENPGNSAKILEEKKKWMKESFTATMVRGMHREKSLRQNNTVPTLKHGGLQYRVVWCFPGKGTGAL